MQAALVKKLTLKRVESFIREAEKLRQIEFPYPDPKDALNDLIKLVKEKKKRHIDSLSEHSDNRIVIDSCSRILSELGNYLPLLGFILRSTNIRNSFELYGPLQRLARKILQLRDAREFKSARLILSSEWDYSPFILMGYYNELPDYMLIGLPACESSNPLLLPLSGHEIGHYIWRNCNLFEKLKDDVASHIFDNILKAWDEYISINPNVKVDSLAYIDKKSYLENDIWARRTWSNAFEYIKRQAEECFCDYMGLVIFRESYLRAFAYFLSPTFAGSRYPYYPNTKDRAQYLVRASTSIGIETPEDYEAMFANNIAPPYLSILEKYQLDLADRTIDSMGEILIKKATDIMTGIGDQYSTNKVNDINIRLEKVIPLEGSESIVNIMIAGWKAYMNDDLWSGQPEISKRKDDILKDLILKNIEILDIEQRGQERPL
jgi:hypothetical protein